MENVKKQNKVLNFFITTLNGMAYGLFATLIIGTILATIARLFKGEAYNVVSGCATLLQCLTGAGIGVGIALALKMDSLKTIALASVGEIASYLSLSFNQTNGVYTNNSFKIGDPLTVYVVVIIAALLIKLVLQKKTPVDILLVPLFSIAIGIIFSLVVRYPFVYVTYGIQYIVAKATEIMPFLMGIIIAILMGMALTAPISSAAIAAMVFTVSSGEAIPEGLAIASGAACIGCCTQMVGFAIQSRKDNKIGIIISVGIGTSMLQFKNILKKPIIWLPTIIASAILGPISTCILKLKCMGSSAGMGTSGLVGQIGTLSTMGNNINTWLIIILFEIITPLVLVFFIDLLFRKLNLIKDGDLTI